MKFWHWSRSALGSENRGIVITHLPREPVGLDDAVWSTTASAGSDRRLRDPLGVWFATAPLHASDDGNPTDLTIVRPLRPGGATVWASSDRANVERETEDNQARRRHDEALIADFVATASDEESLAGSPAVSALLQRQQGRELSEQRLRVDQDHAQAYDNFRSVLMAFDQCWVDAIVLDAHVKVRARDIAAMNASRPQREQRVLEEREWTDTRRSSVAARQRDAELALQGFLADGLWARRGDRLNDGELKAFLHLAIRAGGLPKGVSVCEACSLIFEGNGSWCPRRPGSNGCLKRGDRDRPGIRDQHISVMRVNLKPPPKDSGISFAHEPAERLHFLYEASCLDCGARFTSLHSATKYCLDCASGAGRGRRCRTRTQH